jgi:Ca2+/Na+ antiporter
LHLSADVAGATFMAAGSSGPELATTLIGVFVSKDDIGTSGVIGSAVFNIMLVIGVCAFVASCAPGPTVVLAWWPMFRDSMFYLVSISAMLLVIYDGVVYWCVLPPWITGIVEVLSIQIIYLPPITYYWTVPLILDHSYLGGKLTSSKIADTKVSGFYRF